MQCKKNFPCWDKLTAEEKKIMIDSIDSFNGTIAIYKKEVKDLLCAETSCMFVGTKESTSFPSQVKTCPVCGFKA